MAHLPLPDLKYLSLSNVCRPDGCIWRDAAWRVWRFPASPSICSVLCQMHLSWSVASCGSYYNSFEKCSSKYVQFWSVPLPIFRISLLEFAPPPNEVARAQRRNARRHAPLPITTYLLARSRHRRAGSHACVQVV